MLTNFLNFSRLIIFQKFLHFSRLNIFQPNSRGDCDKQKFCICWSGYSSANCLCYHLCNLGWNYCILLSIASREIRLLMKTKFGPLPLMSVQNHEIILCSVWWCRITWNSFNDPITGMTSWKSLTDHTIVLLHALQKLPPIRHIMVQSQNFLTNYDDVTQCNSVISSRVELFWYSPLFF